jgi:excisionase family DNA binding protein
VKDPQSTHVSDQPDSATIFALLQDLQLKLVGIAQSSDHPTQRYFTIANAAAYCDLSEASIRRLVAARKLTALRPVRGRILLDRQELNAFINVSTSSPRTGRGKVPN